METRLQVGDIQKLLGNASRAKVQYLVEQGFTTTLKESTGVGDWREYSPTNAVAFIVADELIKGGVPRRKLKALFAKTLERKSHEQWFNPYLNNEPGMRMYLVIGGNGEDWLLSQYKGDYLQIGSSDPIERTQPLLKKLREHKERRVMVVDLVAIKAEVRRYLER